VIGTDQDRKTWSDAVLAVMGEQESGAAAQEAAVAEHGQIDVESQPP
jgi:hypothetical protein